MLLTNGFLKVTLEVPACSPCIRCLDVVGVQSQHSSEVTDGLIQAPQLLIHSASVIQCINVAWLQLQDCVVVLQGRLKCACNSIRWYGSSSGLNVGRVEQACDSRQLLNQTQENMI